jgi:hypothetical protein
VSHGIRTLLQTVRFSVDLHLYEGKQGISPAFRTGSPSMSAGGLKQLPPVTEEILRASLVQCYVTCGNPSCKWAGPDHWGNRGHRKGGAGPRLGQ